MFIQVYIHEIEHVDGKNDEPVPTLGYIVYTLLLDKPKCNPSMGMHVFIYVHIFIHGPTPWCRRPPSFCHRAGELLCAGCAGSCNTPVRCECKACQNPFSFQKTWWLERPPKQREGGPHEREAWEKAQMCSNACKQRSPGMRIQVDVLQNYA